MRSAFGATLLLLFMFVGGITVLGLAASTSAGGALSPDSCACYKSCCTYCCIAPVGQASVKDEWFTGPVHFST